MKISKKIFYLIVAGVINLFSFVNAQDIYKDTGNLLVENTNLFLKCNRCNTEANYSSLNVNNGKEYVGKIKVDSKLFTLSVKKVNKGLEDMTLALKGDGFDEEFLDHDLDGVPEMYSGYVLEEEDYDPDLVNYCYEAGIDGFYKKLLADHIRLYIKTKK